MSSERLGPGYIKTPADFQPRPLTDAEAHQVFTELAAKRNEIAFGYLQEGCECRAQLMIEHMEQRGIDLGRAWAVSVGRDLAIADPLLPRRIMTWHNHVAPTVAVAGIPHGVLVVDPRSLPDRADDSLRLGRSNASAIHRDQ